MDWYVPILIFLARVCDVSIGTLRTMIILAGYKMLAVLLGLVEVTIWIFAVGGTLKYLGFPLAVVGYAGGFTCGVLVGMLLEERVALGWRIVRVISRQPDLDLSAALRADGYRVTRVEGRGRDGAVEIAFLVIRRRELRALRARIAHLALDSFITIERVETPAGPGLSESRFGTSLMRRVLAVRK